MNKKITTLLKEQEQLDAYGTYSIVPKETGKFLNYLVQLKQPKRILEVGTSIGYSTLWMSEAMPKKCELCTIERWSDRAEIAKSFFKKSKRNIKLIEGDATKIPLKGRFDFVFLDGTKAEYMKYLKKIKLAKHALIVADNTISHAPRMEDFLKYVAKLGAVTIPLGRGVTVLLL